MPTIIQSAEDLAEYYKEMNYYEASSIKKWHFDNRVYAKIYFNCWINRNSDEECWKSVICKSKDYIKMRAEANSVSDYIVEFYTDKDFEINSIWEKIF